MNNTVLYVEKFSSQEEKFVAMRGDGYSLDYCNHFAIYPNSKSYTPETIITSVMSEKTSTHTQTQV